MSERIRSYKARIDAMLANPPTDIDYEEEMRKHLIQIGFFMHERLIHLIVTVLFAILTVAAIFYASVVPGIGALLLVAVLLCLLIPYIAHYYLLENSVQHMYRQYDLMLARSLGDGVKGSE